MTPNEPQKVTEWLEANDFMWHETLEVWYKPHDIDFGYVPDNQAAFFYRAAHPDPVTGNEYTNKENELYVALEDAVYRHGMDLRMIAKKMIQDRQRILDRVEEEVIKPISSREYRRTILAQIREEEL